MDQKNIKDLWACDEVKHLNRGRLSQITWVGPKCSQLYPFSREVEGELTLTEEKAWQRQVEISVRWEEAQEFRQPPAAKRRKE